MALLDSFFAKPGQSQALGILGAYLMAAGAPTTDPSARGRILAQGTQAYLGAAITARRPTMAEPINRG